MKSGNKLPHSKVSIPFRGVLSVRHFYLALLGLCIYAFATPLHAQNSPPIEKAPANSLHVPITPPWALECWVWEDDHNTAEYELELIKGYEEHDIPARTLLIDSPWSMRYNDFKVDESRYPNPAQFFGDLQKRGYRVVLWATSLVNQTNSDTKLKDGGEYFEEAKSKGYLAAGGEIRKWWKGKGGFIDYSNPDAMKWWQGLQQQVFDWGLDGWKLDGADPYFGTLKDGKFTPEAPSHKGMMTRREYADHYYGDEYRHGLTQNPEFITLARSMDGFIIYPKGWAPLDAAPVCWVGDQKHAWTFKDEGIEEALTFILASAKLGYSVLGSDVGGYHGKEPIPPHVYMRWSQFSAFCGLFLNGGHGERMLWNRTPEELEVIRKFAWLHNELAPYMYSNVVNAHEGGPPLMRVLEAKYHYMFGDDFLVAPIYEDKLEREVALPAGKWRYLFKDKEVVEGPKTFTREYPMNEAPVYVREGAVFPLLVSRPYTGLGDKDSEGFITWCIYPSGNSSFTLHNTDKSGDTTVKVDSGATLSVAFSGTKKPHILRILAEKKPTAIKLDGRALAEGTDWKYNESDARLIIRTRDYSDGKYEIAISK